MYGRDGLQRTAWRRGRARKALGMAVCTLLPWPGAACGNDSAALDEAARVLATDGRKVASLPYVKNKKITDRTSKKSGTTTTTAQRARHVVRLNSPPISKSPSRGNCWWNP